MFFAVTFVLFCTHYLLYVISVLKQLHTSVPLPCDTDDDISLFVCLGGCMCLKYVLRYVMWGGSVRFVLCMVGCIVGTLTECSGSPPGFLNYASFSKFNHSQKCASNV